MTIKDPCTTQSMQKNIIHHAEVHTLTEILEFDTKINVAKMR